MCAAAVVIGLMFLFPLYWLFMYSFKSLDEVLIVSFFPLRPTLQPWRDQIANREFMQSLYNSVFIASFAMCISFVLGITAAYGIGRFNIPGKNALMLLFLVTQMLPATLLLTPLFLTYSNLNLLNTYMAPALAISAGSIPFVVVTLRPYFMSIPKELDDAARIDGCNAFTAFILIMIPIIRSGIITIIVIAFLHGWNDLIYSMTFNVNEDMRPLTANISRFLNQYGTRWNSIMAYGMILVIPVTLAFVFLQKYIVGGLTSGAVKG
jgi:multiple sugar transport system permease protein